MHVAAKDEEAKFELDKAIGSLFGTFMADPIQLTKIAQLAEREPDVFIRQIEERIMVREQIRRNQSVRSLVEDLLRNVLTKEGLKLEVTVQATLW